MRKLRFCLILLALAVLAGALFTAFRPPPEPVYDGQRLSQWILDAVQLPRPPDLKEIHHVDARAIPYLLKWIRYETPPWKNNLFGAINPVLRRFTPNWLLTDQKEQLRADAAMLALIALGPDATAAIGPLSATLTNPKTFRSAVRSANVLEALGKAGLPGLLPGLTNQKGVVRTYVASRIGELGPEARSAVPVLHELCKDPDPAVRYAATNALEKIDH
jgi:hypothetical protein